MADRIELEIDVTEGVARRFLAAYDRIVGAKFRSRGTYLAWPVAILWLILIFNSTAAWSGPTWHFLLITLGSLLVGLGIGVSVLLLPLWKARQLAYARLLTNSPQRIAVSPAGIEVVSPHARQHIAWAGVEDVETSDRALNMVAEGGLIRLPAHHLPAGVSLAQLEERVGRWRAAA
ncbi:MAG: hypothetical protein AAF813_09780 [Pseudomonadota bacterium]